MRKAFIVLTGILFTLLFATCKQFTADIDDYLSRWSSEAFIQSSTIDKKTYNDGSSIPSVASASNVTVTLKVQNPKSFWFVMPSASETRKIVEFAHFAGTKPAAGTDYELIQPSADTLKLIYRKSFLEKAEWGEKDISSTITLYATDGRPFKQAYTLKLKANTPPPKPSVVLAKTKPSPTSPSKYVLCLQFGSAEMTRMVTIGSNTVPVHKDISKITINGFSYPLLYKGDNSDFQKPDRDSFIESGNNVERLDSSSPNVPSGAWVLYFNTGVVVQSDNPQTSYTVTLSDVKGIVSDSVTAELKEKFKVEFNAQDGTPAPGTQYIPNGGKVAKPSQDPTRLGYSFGGWYASPVFSGSAWNFDNNTVTGNMTLYAKWTKKDYTVTFSVVDGTGGTLKAKPEGGAENTTGSVSVAHGASVTFTAEPTDNSYEVDSWSSNVTVTPSTDKKEAKLLNVTETTDKTVTVKFKKKVYNVTFSVEIVDGKAGGKIKADSGNFVENGSTSVEYGGSVGFTAVSTNTDWKVAEWKKDNTVVNGTNSTYTLSNITENKEVTVKFYQSTLKNPTATWKDLARAVKSAPDNATLTINGEIKATDVAYNESQIDVKKNLTIKKAEGATSAVLDADNKGGIFDVYKTLTLQDITLKNSKKPYNYSGGAGVYVNSYGKFIMKGSSVITECSAENSGGGVYVGGGTFEMHDSSTITGCSADKKGGGVYVSSGTFEMHGSSKITGCSAKNSGGGVHVKDGTFKMSGSAVVTPKADSPGKHENDVYLESGKTITIDGTLSNNPAARITPRGYTAGHLYLTGNTNAHHLKFTVTPEKVMEDSENWNVFWYIAADGTLKAEVEDSSLLQEVIRSRPNDTPFIIKLGNIGDLQTVEIPGNKKIMLKADRDVTLTCPNNGHDHYKHLQVQRDATLILEGKIKLQGADYGDKDHYALCVEKDGNAEIKDGVTITGFKNTGRGTVFVDGNLTMSGGTITGNKARNKGDGTAYDDGKGGGVYICPNRSFTMTGGTIADNEAGNGGGVYVSADHQQFMYGNFIMKGGTIKNNKATVSSVYSYIEYTGHGGGVCVDGYFTMEGGTITGNQSERNCKAVQAENDFYWKGGDIKDNGGANQTVSGIRAVANRNDSIYYFHNNTNPRKEPS